MAPPPLPPDYGNSGGGWAAAAPAPAPSTAPANDDWGWSSGNTETNSRYQNTPADDPWGSSSNNADNNFNQAGSSDPFDPFDQPPKQSSTAPPPVTASANQVTSQNPDKNLDVSSCFSCLTFFCMINYIIILDFSHITRC